MTDKPQNNRLGFVSPPPRVRRPVEPPNPASENLSNNQTSRPIKPLEEPMSEVTDPNRTIPIQVGEHLIGYKKPPPHGRFSSEPGKGNRKGRPKGTKSYNTIVRDVMEAKVPVRTAKGTTRVSRFEASILKTVERAFGGSDRSMDRLLRMYRDAKPEASDADPEDHTQSTEMDDAIITAFLAMKSMGELANDEDTITSTDEDDVAADDGDDSD